MVFDKLDQMFGKLNPLVWKVNPFNPKMGPIPDPPPMPKYDPEEEAPMWDWHHLYEKVTKMPGSDLWPKVGGVPKDDDKPDWRGVIKSNVDVWPNPGGYNYGQQQPPYMWFDTPDYADPFKKLWWSFKNSLKAGVFLWTLDCALTEAPFNWAGQQRLMARCILPVFAVGMVGSLTVLTVANLRGCVDDYWNYGIASVITALFMGRNNFHRGFRYMVVLPIMAITAKHVAENNLMLVPMFNYRSISHGVSGMSTEYGPKSGDFRFGITTFGKPDRVGRDVRDLPRF